MGINFNNSWAAKLGGNINNTNVNKTVTVETSQTESAPQAQNEVGYVPGKSLTTTQWKNLVLNNGTKIFHLREQTGGANAEIMEKDWGEIGCYGRTNRPDVAGILDQGAKVGDTFKCDGVVYLITDVSIKGDGSYAYSIKAVE